MKPRRGDMIIIHSPQDDYDGQTAVIWEVCESVELCLVMTSDFQIHTMAYDEMILTSRYEQLMQEISA